MSFWDSLTRRETQVWELASKGQDVRAIAKALSVKPGTVSGHLSKARNKYIRSQRGKK